MRRLLLLLLICFCVPAMAAETESVSYGEPWGASFRFWADRIDGEHAVFLFDTAVEEETRWSCMNAVDELLKKLPPMEKPEICLTPKRLFAGEVIVGNRLYISSTDWQSIDFAARVLQTAAGEYSHYGLAYGLAGWLHGQTGEFAVMQEMAAYDLNLLCFDAAFVEDADAVNAREISICFAADYIAAHGVEKYLTLLLESDTADGMRAVAGALQMFYAAHDVETEISTLRYTCGGKAYQYRVMLDGAIFHVGREFQDVNHEINPLVSERFLHEEYADVRMFFSINEEQMAQYRRLLTVPGYRGDVTVLLLNPQRMINTSYYKSNEHMILMLNINSIMHEYIHSLMQPRPTQSLWETEGFATYFSYYYDHYGRAMLNADYNDPPDLAHVQFIRDYLNEVGRPIEMAVDFGDIESLGAYARGDRSPDMSYASGSAFVHYLVQRFGEEAVIRHVCGLEKLTQDVDVLTAEWLEWLNENYQKYSMSEVE